MDYKTRPATPGDHDLIYGLKAASIRPYVEKIWGWDEEYQRGEFDRDFSAIEEYQVIEVDGRFAGFVQACCAYPFYEINEIHLLPEYRGKGIGSNLLWRVQNEHVARGEWLRIGCFKENHRAKALYQRLGFVQTEETDTHYILEYPV